MAASDAKGGLRGGGVTLWGGGIAGGGWGLRGAGGALASRADTGT